MRNWRRSCTLSLSGPKSTKVVKGGGPTDLRIRFEIISHTIQSPNVANFIISNPSMDTVSKVQNEFTALTFDGGYEDHSGRLFAGTIVETQWGLREGWTDPLLMIWAADSDAAYNQAKVNTSLAAGYTPMDVVNLCLKAMEPYGVTLGAITGVDLSQPRDPRGGTFSGMAKDYLRDIATHAQATFNLFNGQLNIIGKNATKPGAGLVLNSKTGLISQPIATQDGIIVKCLINSKIDVDSNLVIDQASIVKSTYNDAAAGTTLANQVGISAQDQSMMKVTDGTYRVLHVVTTGDTRGNDWYMTCTCIGSSGSVTNAQKGLGYS